MGRVAPPRHLGIDGREPSTIRERAHSAGPIQEVELVESPVIGDVEFPDMRREVQEAVRVLADTGYQERLWLPGVPPGNGVMDWDLVVHTLYDDTFISEDSRSTVGYILRDVEEAEILDRVIEALNRVFKQLSSMEAPVREVLRTPAWPDVVARAAAACALLDRNDRERAESGPSDAP